VKNGEWDLGSLEEMAHAGLERECLKNCMGDINPNDLNTDKDCDIGPKVMSCNFQCGLNLI